MKDIIFLGKDTSDSFILKQLKESANYKVRKTSTLKEAQKAIATENPDFVLFSGKIKLDPEGNYVLEF
ncbi:MAG: hypothetical protein D6743_16485 [Calditrichaeota bacterium]|nr:MAG: hypothetical protein D6743_16485 [Calditrichota bacterium]